MQLFKNCHWKTFYHPYSYYNLSEYLTKKILSLSYRNHISNLWIDYRNGQSSRFFQDISRFWQKLNSSCKATNFTIYYYVLLFLRLDEGINTRDTDPGSPMFGNPQISGHKKNGCWVSLFIYCGSGRTEFLFLW